MYALSNRIADRPPVPEFLGIFSPRRAGALAGVSGNQVGQWARYGLIRPSVYQGRPANLYAFFDVAEAIVVHWLRERGFNYDQIHHAIAVAHKAHTDWALLRAQVGVASAVEGDRGVIAEKVGGEYVDIGRPGGQAVLKPELFEFASDMLRSGGWLANKLGLERIEVDPRKLGGAPSLRGRRWPVERVARIAADAEGRSILIDDYGLDDRDVDESVRWTEAAAALV
jgi:uncharacterized protein (DUF433 family)/DNA-binding transcriptional MerR regulator